MQNYEIVQYWYRSSQENLESMHRLFVANEYSWSLFLGHLALEKLLKAIYTQNHDADVPRIHDLKRLAQQAGLELTDETSKKLDTITLFNLNAIYPDYKS